MRLILDFEKPPGADVEDLALFVSDSLSSYGGGFHPNDLMFHSLRGRICWVTVHGRKFVPDEARYGQRLTAMAEQARTGYYHDFLSPLALPEMQLVDDLMSASLIKPNKDEILELRERVICGEFDASVEESEEWAALDEGQETFRKLVR